MSRLGPVIRKTTSREAGGCNYCNGFMTSSGETVHEIFEVVSQRNNGNISVRFCDQCFALLAIAIDRIEKSEKK